MIRPNPSLAPIVGLCLALVLALTGAAMAVARGQTMTAGGIVLCTGAGPVSVPLDAQGNPVGPVHICPDCALGLFDATASVAAVPAFPAAFVPLRAARSGRQVSGVPGHAPKARAPPVV